METSRLRKFAQYARRYLLEQVSAKLEFVLTKDSAGRRENPKSVQELENKIRENSKEQVIEKVAYIWFNRFCALRFMDVNRYTRIGTVSAVAGQFQPEILAEAKLGHIDENMVPEKVREKVYALLNGTTTSKDPQAEAYNLLLVAVCNYQNRMMPFLFERIADYTELLMPDDLLSGNSILAYIREAMTPDICEDVEVIGWLYQFYISEKKDEVFEGLKKNKKITPENIPAATQLFTPHWIVRYLVENSLGRLWMLNRPNSQLKKRMDYYIEPEEPETDFLKVKSPEEIKVCDPACGSGHMLVYAFDLLYSMYEEEGYEPSEIAGKILTNNLYGVEIDERAGELAAFALIMKAQSRYRRFLRKPVPPNICVLENIHFKDSEIKAYMDAVGRDLFTVNLQTTLRQFEEADNFGSLIRPALKNVKDILRLVEAKRVTENLFLRHIHGRVIKVLRQTDFLNTKYHVVIANPPYMGGGSMNPRLKVWAQDNYPDSKADLFAMFIERNIDLAVNRGVVGMITMQSWMFLSTFEAFRKSILNRNTIISMAHLGARAFDSIGGEVVSTTAFVISNAQYLEFQGTYFRLVNGICEAEKDAEFKAKRYDGFRASSLDFKKIPGSPLVYWVSKKVRDTFILNKYFSEYFFSDGLTKTGDNDKYLRFHWEIKRAIAADHNSYRICVKGGDARNFYGNTDVMVNWRPNVRDHYRSDNVARITPEYLWYASGISWTKISSKGPTFRWLGDGMIAETGGPAIFLKENQDKSLLSQGLGFLTSKVCWNILTSINPTLNFQTSDVLSLPFNTSSTQDSAAITSACVLRAKYDWNCYETSYHFTELPLLQPAYHKPSLEKTYGVLRASWRDMTLEMRRLQEENNQIFIEAYGLRDELRPSVLLSEITLTCNPHYRYGNNKSEQELESLLLADTMKEFISYGVGCMFGRYSLDRPGLILANQGETIEDYLKQVPNPTFPANKDNVIPMLEGDWFPDDISEQFRKFLRATFGEDHFEENLKFVEDAMGKDIRKYLLKDFYSDHVKRYKKRPIYWLFSSPKGSFNALIYVHRYRPDTVSVVLNDYLREFRTKLISRKGHLEQVSISGSASQREKTGALKEIERLGKMIRELEDYERDVLYPLATKQVEIDLDDGVKVNYPKFGVALRKIPGLDAKEED